MNKLKETEDYLHAWLVNLHKANKIAPTVQEALEEVSWARQAMSFRPPESNSVSTALVQNWAETAHTNISNALPMIPSFTSTSATQVSSSATFSNTAVVSYIIEVGEIGTPAATEYAHKQIDIYNTIKEKHSRPALVRKLLAKRWHSCLERFDEAIEAYKKNTARTGTETAAAIEIRTALESVKGELFEEARTSSREKMDWSKMAHRLGCNEEHRKRLIDQETIHKTLHDHLSNMAKRRPANQLTSIDAIWAMFLDHLFVMLT